jgi:hypothetical protein
MIVQLIATQALEISLNSLFSRLILTIAMPFSVTLATWMDFLKIRTEIEFPSYLNKQTLINPRDTVTQDHDVVIFQVLTVVATA